MWDVETELEKMIGVLKEHVPQLKQVSVFGDYINGRWNPARSLISLYILTEDEHLYSREDMMMTSDGILDSPQRRALRATLLENYGKKLRDRWAFFICTPRDVERLENAEGSEKNLAESIFRGRRIYP